MLALPGCGATCNVVTPDLVASPATLAAPGRVVELDAVGSIADRCLDGLLQYRYWIDGDGNGVSGDNTDTLLRDFTADPTFVDAPARTTDYIVEVRCSADPTCVTELARRVPVDCPGTTGFDALGGPIVAAADASFSWPLAVASAPRVQGLLSALDASYVTTATGSATGTSFSTIGDDPTSGDGIWYLVKAEGRFCNQFSWSSAGAGELPLPGRDASLP